VPGVTAPTAGVLEIFGTFLRIGAISFGGGAIGYLRKSLVDDKRWLDDEQFLSGLELAQTLPGLNAVNMGVYVGERLRGAAGALAAILGLVLPGLTLVLALGASYSAIAHEAPALLGALHGVAAAATGFLLYTAIRVGRDQLIHWQRLLFVVVTFVTMSVLQLPLVWIILGLGGVAVWLNRPGQRGFELPDSGLSSDPSSDPGPP
jgi:chromate transporter